MRHRINNNQNELSIRNRSIYEERVGGAMVIELSDKYGLSIPRIHRICQQEELKELRETNIRLENRVNSCENILQHKRKEK